VYISTRINSSDALMTLILAINTIKGKIKDCRITVYLNYMPYQQSDQYLEADGLFECFGLKAVAEILNSLPVSRYVVVDPHSIVTPALLKNCSVMSNVDFVKYVLKRLRVMHRESEWTIKHNLTVLSTDAGAYKKVFKLCAEVDQLDEVIIESANKHRNSKGELTIKVSTQDFQGRDVLIFVLVDAPL
jgi:ribose-phosphate pyrophosphokinase